MRSNGKDLGDGGKLGVSGTPTTLIRNNRNGASEVIVGAVGADALAPAIAVCSSPTRMDGWCCGAGAPSAGKPDQRKQRWQPLPL